MLGYLVGRGDRWRDPAQLLRCKRAIGPVMAGAYAVLAPVWAEHPTLDPARVQDPLGLCLAALPAGPCSPADLTPFIVELRGALPEVQAVLASEPPRGGIIQLNEAVHELQQALNEAECVLGP